MRLRGQFTVLKFYNPSGNIVWRVTGTKVTGERVQKNYPTEKRALEEKQTLENEAANVPTVIQRKETRLTNEQLAEAEAAFNAAQAKGWSFSELFGFALDNYTQPLKPIILKEAFDKFMEARKAENLRPDSIKNLDRRVGHLVKNYAQSKVSDIQPEQIRAVITAHGRRGKTLVPKGPIAQDNERRALSSFFAWATRQGYCAKNPMVAIDAIKTERDEPTILSVSECRKLMHAAESHKGGALVPYFTLALFCAVRPTELKRIGWRDIDLEQGTITLGGKSAKMRARRIIELPALERLDKDGNKIHLPPNVADWLREHAPKHTPIIPKNWRRDFDRIKRLAGFGTQKPLCCKPTVEAGKQCKKRCCRIAAEKGKVCEQCHTPDKLQELKPWEPDVLRHTGISCHLAHFQHEGKTATWAGNSPDVIQRHYKGLVKTKEAAEFWDIRPDAKKVIALPETSTASQARA